MENEENQIEQLAQTWKELGEQDPLWAVVSHDNKRGNKWDLTEFMQTGETTVAHYRQLIASHISNAATFSHILDFGCGVGRLTRAWSQHARQVTGVDISDSMLANARKNLAESKNIRFVLNQNDNLHIFQDETFDLVFSVICLQHIPPSIAMGYITEFARVCRRGGVVAFQLPSRTLCNNYLSKFRKTIINILPFGLGRLYRRWRHGSSVVFDVYYTPSSKVEATATASGLNLIHREPNTGAGPNTEGFFYIFQKL